MKPKTKALLFMLLSITLTLFMVFAAFGAAARGSIMWLIFDIALAAWNAYSAHQQYHAWKSFK